MAHHCEHSTNINCTQPLSDQVSTLLAQAEKLCDQRNIRLTPSRRHILELVCNYSQPVGAYTLLDDLKEEGISAAPPTVYRALDFLLENGLIHRLATNNTYLACAHPESKHEGLFLVCDECGHTQEVHTKKVVAAVDRAASGYDFEMHHASVEVTGLCKDCRDS